MTSISIDRRKVGPGSPTYFIAELSANHGGSFDQAVRLVEAAKECGAEAVKLQTYTADTLTIRSDQAPFRITGGTLWDGRTLHDLYGEAYMPWEWQPKLCRVANDLGMSCFSSAFDPTAVAFLESIDVPAYKVASLEIVDVPLLRCIGATGKPVILSTGGATLAEIDEAVGVLRESGCEEIALLKCTSAYPAAPDEMNLRTIPHLAQAFGLPVGLSDHTLGVAVAVAAVALGASIIEKHLTLSREDPGPDSAFSLEPAEFKTMVEAVRVAEVALGDVHYGRTPQEEKNLVFRRSLFVVGDVKAGDRFTEQNVRSIRPGFGLHPRFLPNVLGRQATHDIDRGTPLTWSHVGGVTEVAHGVAAVADEYEGE